MRLPVFDEGIPNRQCNFALIWRPSSSSAGFCRSVPARSKSDDRHMNALWFCEMCKKSSETMLWFAELPRESVDAVAIRLSTVEATNLNSSRCGD